MADFIGKPAPQGEIDSFVKTYADLTGKISLHGVDEPLSIAEADLRTTAAKFLFAVKTAGQVYRKIESEKGKGNFIPEVSMDETDRAQSPVELLTKAKTNAGGAFEAAQK